MKKLFIFISFFSLSCNSDENVKEQSKQEILEAEKAFAQMAKDVGISNAFIAFADKSATIERSNQLIIGIDSIAAHFSAPAPEGTKLEWTPDFVDASISGDLGYTYGKFTYTRLDSVGNPEKITGIFHTVWKRQEDGSWKYVWD
jgi:ketosteroid isomerase-like protein